MATKKPDDKATVSFSSDSDGDDSSSSSSRLSSSESSGEESETETVTFAVPFPSKGQATTQGKLVEPAAKAESVTRVEAKKTDHAVKAVSPAEPRKSPVAEAKEKSPLRRTKVAEEAASKNEKLLISEPGKEFRKSPGKIEGTADTLEVTKRGENSLSGGRAKSPKITISDVDEDPPKQAKKSAEIHDVTVTSNKATSKIRAASQKKTSDNAESESTTLSSKSKNDGGAEDSDGVTKTTKKSSKLTAERTKSPKDTEEEPEVKSIDRANSPKKTAGDKDLERAKSPKKTLEENDSERAKSPKKTLNAKDTERSKSPKKSSEERDLGRPTSATKTLEENDAERGKSPKKTTEEENGERAKSPRTSTKDVEEAKKKPSKDSSKTPYELLRTDESPEKSPSPTRSTKTKKSLITEDETSTSKRKSPLKDLEGKELETPDAVEPVKPKKASKKTGKNTLTDDSDLSTVDISKKVDETSPTTARKDGVIDQTSKIEGSGTKVTDPSDSANEVELLLKEIRQKRISQMANEPQPESEAQESGNELIRVTVDKAAGKTGDASKTTHSDQKEAEVKDKDYMKVTSSSRNPTDESTTGTKPDLENEESEFTYRRKSMDEFIKRILAEAKEERLKQKHGGGGSSTETMEEERKAGVDRYADRNGDITENGLDRTKWNNSEEKEGSMLDRRLAKIEKRRFGASSDAVAGKGAGGGEGEVEGERSKVSKEKEEDGKVGRTTKSAKDATDYDVNLDEDLEEINRFLQARKTAAARFDFDDQALNDDTTATTTTQTKRRWATDKEQQQQQPEEEDLASIGSRSQIKKYGVDLDFNDDDEHFLGRFKRERDSALPEDSFSPRRRNETDEIVRERTRNVRVLVDQQVEIVQAMRTTSKSLDDLEKEIREVRQVCLNRQARIDALEGELGAEYRAFETDQMAASDRQRSADGSVNSREDFGLAGFGRLRRQDKFKSESLDEENFPFRRRSGSVASTTSYTSGFDVGGGRGRPGGDGSNDGVDSRPPSGLKQSRDLRRTSESESDFSSGLDRRRGGSAARDRTSDVSSSLFGPDDITNTLLGQRPARSRASIATSNPAVDYAGTISGDSFLAKIRAKYSFLAPSIDNQGYSGSTRGQTSSRVSYANPYSLTSSDSRYGSRLGSRDILSSSSAYSSLGTGYGSSGGDRYSISDTRSYGTGGFSNSSSIAGISSSYADSGRMRRAQSVSEVSFDRPTASLINLGSSSGGEFHSRFLDKVRGKKAMGDDASAASEVPTKGQEKPFKSRFLKTTSFDAGSSSRSERLTNGFDDGGDGGEHKRGGGSSSEINGTA